MATLVAGQKLWSELRHAARKSRNMAAAVAFVGKNPEKIMRWPKGSRLVTAITEERVLSGATSAKGIKKLVKLDVGVRSSANLHAKVYVFDHVAFVGSANASESSSRLEEAAVMLSKPAEIASARAFVNDLWRSADPTDLRILNQLAMHEPEWAGGRGLHPGSRPSANGQTSILNGRSLWVHSVGPLKTAALVDRLREGVARQLATAEEVPSESAVEWTTMSRKDYREIPEQDWIFVWWEPTPESPRGRLEGPLRCLGGIDLGKRAGGDRYSRAEHGVQSTSFALDAPGLRLLARLTRLRKIDSSPAFARQLNDRLGRRTLKLTRPEDIRAFEEMVKRRTERT